jgi:hypothetical protein
MANEVIDFELTTDPVQAKVALNAAFDGTTQTALKAESAVNVTTNINGHAITDIFESDGTTVKKATHAASADNADAWLAMPPLTYVDGQSATATGDYTDTIQKGDKFWCEQTINKYAFIIGVSYNIETGLTTFTFSPFGDSEGAVTTLVNAPINNPYYSKIENPQGFPEFINYVPTCGAGGSMTYTSISIIMAKFKIHKNSCQVRFAITGTIGGTRNPKITASLPVPPAHIDGRFRGGNIVIQGLESHTAGHYQISTANLVDIYTYNSVDHSLGPGIGFMGIVDFQY